MFKIYERCSLRELVNLVAAALRSLLVKRSFSISFPWLLNYSALGSPALHILACFSCGGSAVESPTGVSESTGDITGLVTTIPAGDGGGHGDEHSGEASAKKIK